jgi:hypothetical protein
MSMINRPQRRRRDRQADKYHANLGKRRAGAQTSIQIGRAFARAPECVVLSEVTSGRLLEAVEGDEKKQRRGIKDPFELGPIRQKLDDGRQAAVPFKGFESKAALKIIRTRDDSVAFRDLPRCKDARRD